MKDISTLFIMIESNINLTSHEHKSDYRLVNTKTIDCENFGFISMVNKQFLLQSYMELQFHSHKDHTKHIMKSFSNAITLELLTLLSSLSHLQRHKSITKGLLHNTLVFFTCGLSQPLHSFKALPFICLAFLDCVFYNQTIALSHNHFQIS
jgi:hypothetical protein